MNNEKIKGGKTPGKERYNLLCYFMFVGKARFGGLLFLKSGSRMLGGLNRFPLRVMLSKHRLSGSDLRLTLNHVLSVQTNPQCPGMHL